MSVSAVKRIGGLALPKEEVARRVEEKQPSSGTGYAIAKRPSHVIASTSARSGGVYGSSAMAKPAVKKTSLEGTPEQWEELIYDVIRVGNPNFRDPSFDLHRNPLRNA